MACVSESEHPCCRGTRGVRGQLVPGRMDGTTGPAGACIPFAPARRKGHGTGARSRQRYASLFCRAHLHYVRGVLF
jgi:hypothetical protein